MHQITLTLTGVATDTVTVDLGDVEAFTLFVALKSTLVGGAPAKRKARRGTSTTTSDETSSPAIADENEEA